MDLHRTDPENLQLLGDLAAEIGAYACNSMHGPFADPPDGTPSHPCLSRRAITEYAYDLLRHHSARVQKAPARPPYVPPARRAEFPESERDEDYSDTVRPCAGCNCCTRDDCQAHDCVKHCPCDDYEA